MKRIRRRLTYCCSSFFFVLALLSALACVAFVVVKTKYLDGIIQQPVDQVIKKVELLPGTQGTQTWIHAPAPVFAKFHFFNLNNPDEFLAGGKPSFTDVGPFVYWENKTKFDVQWNYDETEVQYHLSSLYNLDLSLSCGDPHQVKITQVNTVIVGLLHYIENHLSSGIEKDLIDFFLRHIVERGLLKDSFVQTRSVHEWLWGYNDTFLDDVDKVVKEFNKIFKKNISIPQSLIALQTNNSLNDSQGWSTVYTGKGDISKIAWYKEWNSLTHINGWLDDGGDLLGGEGVLVQPGLSRNDTVYAFINQLFRSGYFTYTEDTSIYDIKLYRYTIPKVEMENATENSANAKFYAYGLSGVLNLTSVFPLNAPVFASKPHFLDADPLFLDNVTGLMPNRSIHDSHLDVEPNTGGVLRAAKRIQINFDLWQSKYFDDLKHIHDVMFPVMYAAEEGNITEDLAKTFKTSVYGEITVVDDLFVAGIVVSGVLSVAFFLLAVCIICCCCCCQRPDRHHGRRMNHMVNVDEREPLLS